jgi:hypothetical protein
MTMPLAVQHFFVEAGVATHMYRILDGTSPRRQQL